MGFNNGIIEEIEGLTSGEVIKSKPNNVEAFEVFEDGIISGRFVKYEGGSIDALDAGATPKIAGVLKRKINNELGVETYRTTGTLIDQVAEVCNFGLVTVDVVAGQTPSRYDAVQAHNVADADAGKAVTSGGVETGAVFWEEVETDVWSVLLPNYLV